MNKNMWKFYLRNFKGDMTKLVFSVCLTIVQPIILLPIVLLVRYTFDDIIPDKDINKVIFVGIIIIILYIISNGISLLSQYITLKTTKTAILNLRKEILNKFYTYPRSYYSNMDRIKLHTVIVQDTQRVDIGSNALISLLLPSVIISIALCAILLFLDWQLSLIMMAILPIIFFFSRIIGGKIKKWTNRSHRLFESFSKGMFFVLQMMDLTRMRSAEKYEINRQIKILNELRHVGRLNAWLKAVYKLTQNTLIYFSGVMILIIGSIAVINEYMSIGELLSFYVAMGMLKMRLNIITTSIVKLIEGHESLTSLYNLYNKKYNRPYNGSIKIDFNGGIKLESVCFSHRENDLLKDINLEILPDSFTAICGPNGTGKSTIINLILGFYKPQQGSLYANYKNYENIDITQLRKQIGVVPQDPMIFPASILDNITYGYPVINRTQVLEAARIAGIGQFIEQLPLGYDTYIGENGMLLSGGQCQGIAIAHALLLKPKLLILDEPTNHLDEKIVKSLIRNLKSLSFNPAILTISHNKVIQDEAHSIFIIRNNSLIKIK